MNQILIFLLFLSGVVFLGGVLGAGAVWVLLNKKIKELEVELKRTEGEIEEERALLRSCELRTGKEETAFGLGEFNQKAQEIKEKRKRLILNELNEKGKVQTNQTADLLLISRASAFRYLEELEKEGRIEQVGAFGRNVEYKIK